jgi:two-component system cell cycle sensor histidine kinase/response regulator CckA
VMPKMSGPELAMRLVAMRPALKVLCVSGYTDDALARHGAIDASSVAQ